MSHSLPVCVRRHRRCWSSILVQLSNKLTLCPSKTEIIRCEQRWNRIQLGSRLSAYGSRAALAESICSEASLPTNLERVGRIYMNRGNRCIDVIHGRYNDKSAFTHAEIETWRRLSERVCDQMRRLLPAFLHILHEPQTLPLRSALLATKPWSNGNERYP